MMFRRFLTTAALAISLAVAVSACAKDAPPTAPPVAPSTVQTDSVPAVAPAVLNFEIRDIAPAATVDFRNNMGMAIEDASAKTPPDAVESARVPMPPGQIEPLDIAPQWTHARYMSTRHNSANYYDRDKGAVLLWLIKGAAGAAGGRLIIGHARAVKSWQCSAAVC